MTTILRRKRFWPERCCVRSEWDFFACGYLQTGKSEGSGGHDRSKGIAPVGSGTAGRCRVTTVCEVGTEKAVDVKESGVTIACAPGCLGPIEGDGVRIGARAGVKRVSTRRELEGRGRYHDTNEPVHPAHSSRLYLMSQKQNRVPRTSASVPGPQQ